MPKTVKLDFYFDPSCPFCWVTSRWLLMVSNQVSLNITWRPFSLAMKNGELADSRADQPHLAAHRVLRVMAAAVEQGSDIGQLYTKLGIRHFLSGDAYNDDLIVAILHESSLDVNLIQAADDQTRDRYLSESMETAIKTVGSDIGVPTIVFEINNQKMGYFGPVLQSLPDKKEALELWDGLFKLAKQTKFYELKRGRDGNGPDVFSTAKC